MTEYTSRYTTTPDKVHATLDKYGVAVIPNILNEDELKSIRTGMWDILEHITSEHPTPIKRDETKTWRTFYDLMPMHSMLIQHHSIGHTQPIWDIRQNQKVVDVFAHLHETKQDQLLVSFDGCSIHLPPEITGKGWYRKSWYHTDQSYLRNDFECAQGFITAYDVNDKDATLTVLEGSHKYHKEFSEYKKFKQLLDRHKKKKDLTEDEQKLLKQAKKDWYKLDVDEEKFYLSKGCKRTAVECKAGSIVLWDSRTIHCGKEAEKERKEPNTRFVVYVCMMNKKLCKPADLKKRIKAFEELRMTTHWPCKPKLFGKTPQTYGKEFIKPKMIKKPKLTSLGKSLVGY
jgi:ectoine hydroxylase-related dioxygenase (phytanoyl-CoA dioxygenase family)